MTAISKPCVYFSLPGKKNTDECIACVGRRLEEGDIRTVVAASTTGYTAGKLADALQGRGITIVAIGESPLAKEWDAKTEYPFLKPEVKLDLERRGVIVGDKVPYLLHSSVLDYSRWQVPTPDMIVRELLYAFGQGMKVAVEVALQAVAAGLIEPYQKVVAIGGTARGADTAAVLRATFPNHVLSQDAKKRLEIYEVLCKPL